MTTFYVCSKLDTSFIDVSSSTNTHKSILCIVTVSLPTQQVASKWIWPHHLHNNTFNLIELKPGRFISETPSVLRTGLTVFYHVIPCLYLILVAFLYFYLFYLCKLLWLLLIVIINDNSYFPGCNSINYGCNIYQQTFISVINVFSHYYN